MHKEKSEEIDTDEIIKTTRMTEQKMIEEMKIRELTLQKKTHEIENKLKKEIEEQIKKHEKLLVEMEEKLKEQEKKNLFSGIGGLFYPPNTTIRGSGGLLEVRGVQKSTGRTRVYNDVAASGKVNRNWKKPSR